VTRYLLDTNIIRASAALASAASGFGAATASASSAQARSAMIIAPGSKIGGIDSAGTLLRAPITHQQAVSQVTKFMEADAMPSDEYFGTTYQQTRSKFLDAAHPDLLEYFRVLKWFGPEVTSTVKGDSASASIRGSLADSVRACAGSIRSTYIAVEFGTIPVMEVFGALRADNWLHAYSDQSDPNWAAMKKGIRDAFYVDESWWKTAVYGRSVDMILRAGRGLSSP